MSEAPAARELGKHDAQITTLQIEVMALRADVAEIKDMLNRTKGGWQALTIVATIAGSIGAMAMKLMTSSPAPHP